MSGGHDGLGRPLVSVAAFRNEHIGKARQARRKFQSLFLGQVANFRFKGCIEPVPQAINWILMDVLVGGVPSFGSVAESR